MSVFTLVYFAYVLVRLFKLTFFQLIIKTIYFTFLSIIILLFIGILMNVVMMMYMGPENYLKQFKPPNTNDSIQKIEKLDSTKVLQKKDTIKKLVLD